MNFHTVSFLIHPIKSTESTVAAVYHSVPLRTLNMYLLMHSLSLFLSVFLLACAEGTYGVQCNSLCVCKNGGRCDPVTGKCLCPPGVQGLHCENGTAHKLYVLSSNVFQFSWLVMFPLSSLLAGSYFNIYKNIFLHL